LDPDLIMSLAPAACQRDGRYEALVPLNGDGGDGVFSVVFRAKRTGTDTTVALKFFSDSDLYRRLAFDREGKLLSTTFQNEDSFVKTVAGREEVVVELTTAEGRKVGLPLPFIAFEWMPNGTLETFCTTPPTSAHEVLRRLRLLRSVCRCVQRLHNLKCAHRDLKPGNFLLARSDEVKLGDFGTAKLLVPGEPDLQTKYSGPVGDLGYAAPEVLAGIVVERHEAQLADVFSIGAVVFEMMTGQPLFEHTLLSLERVHEFTLMMHSVPEQRRRDLFLRLIDAQPWKVPPILALNPNIPRIVHHELDRLIFSMAQLDFRKRLQRPSDAHRLAQICELRLAIELRRLTRRGGPNA
jgi:serine/threonine protein kinase